jgi:hypothetical protein
MVIHLACSGRIALHEAYSVFSLVSWTRHKAWSRDEPLKTAHRDAEAECAYNTVRRHENRPCTFCEPNRARPDRGLLRSISSFMWKKDRVTIDDCIDIECDIVPFETLYQCINEEMSKRMLLSLPMSLSLEIHGSILPTFRDLRS